MVNRITIPDPEEDLRPGLEPAGTSLAVARPSADPNIGLQNGGNAGAAQFATGGTGSVAPTSLGVTDSSVQQFGAEDIPTRGAGTAVSGIDIPQFQPLGDGGIPQPAGADIEEDLRPGLEPAGPGVPPEEDPSKITIGDVELIDFGQAAKLLEGGSIDAVITDYTERVAQELPLPTADIPGVGSVNVAFGTDRLAGTDGWGYVDQDGQFTITAETNIAGQNFQRASEQIDQMEAFIQQVALAEDQSARNLLVSQELARVNAEFNLAQTGAAGEEARETVAFQGEIASEQQQAGQEFSQLERLASESFASAEAQLGREFTTEERTAIQAFQQDFLTRQQEFAGGERLAGEAEDRAAAELGREFTSGEREAIQAFNTSRDALAREQEVEDISGAQGFQRETTQQSQAFQTGREEDRQTFEREEAFLQRNFQTQRDSIEFQRKGLIESARSGIANALSDEGINEAVKRAEEARNLERSLALVDIIQKLSGSGLSRQLADSGILQSLADEFGVDFSFLLRGGLDTGGSGRSAVRVTA